jgi:hypothetical protein
MIPDSLWIQSDAILDFFVYIFEVIGDILGFLVGVGDPIFNIGGFALYPIDSILVILLAGVFVFYTTFTGKFNAVVAAREEKIKNMYIRSSPEDVKNKRWENISYLIRTPNPADWRVAIIDCDNMLDDLFQRLGYPGATLGERMKNATKANFPTLESAWEAHKVRNLIAHDGSFVLDAREALRVYYLYERVFRDAGYI